MELKLTTVAIALLMSHSPLAIAKETVVNDNVAQIQSAPSTPAQESSFSSSAMQGEASLSIPTANAIAYRDSMDVERYWKSEKLDGIRVIWNGRQLMTRQGNPIAAPAWFTEGLPTYPVEGELWAGRGKFALVQSTVLDQTPHETAWRQITYMLFDLPTTQGDFAQRYHQLQTLIEQINQSHIQYVEQSPIVSKADLMDYLDHIVAAGGEGVMLRKVAAPYRAGRGEDWVKLKRYQDDEAVIVGYKEGTGKYRGMVGSLRVQLADGTEFYIGSGLSDAQRENPPAIGQTVTFRYNGYTQHGIPRFARLVRERLGF